MEAQHCSGREAAGSNQVNWGGKWRAANGYSASDRNCRMSQMRLSTSFSGKIDPTKSHNIARSVISHSPRHPSGSDSEVPLLSGLERLECTMPIDSVSRSCSPRHRNSNCFAQFSYRLNFSSALSNTACRHPNARSFKIKKAVPKIAQIELSLTMYVSTRRCTIIGNKRHQ